MRNSGIVDFLLGIYAMMVSWHYNHSIFFLVLHWYAYSTYYLGDDGGRIAVYQGQPNGVLWYKPIKVRDTNYKVAHLRAADRQSLMATIEEPTLASALEQAAALHSAWQLGQSPSSATTTTTLKKAAG